MNPIRCRGDKFATASNGHNAPTRQIALTKIAFVTVLVLGPSVNLYVHICYCNDLSLTL